MTIFFLPGKEDDILTSGRKLGITGTAVLWFAFVLVSAFMPDFKKKTEYKTVRITLASVPVERTVEPAAVPEPAPEEPVKEQVQAAAAEPENVPAQVKKAEPAKKAAAARKQEPAQTSGTGTKKTTPKPSVTYAKDPMDQFAEQTKTQKENAAPQRGDSALADASITSNAAVQSTPQAKQITGASALSGTAAAAAQQNDGPVSSTSAAENKKPGSADALTKAALGAISSTTDTPSGGSGERSQSVEKGEGAQISVNTGRSVSGKVAAGISDITTSKGKARKLLSPEKPAI
ncbi:MAG TPA: hypothetical protein DCL73_08570, partial [Treponema sp.]|nr:hypothetical protein [Treponema sp.]